MQTIKRIDAIEKVTGAPIYASDRTLPGMLHAAVAGSSIVRGRIVELDTSAADALDGVHLVLTHANMPAAGEPGFLMGGGFGFQSFQPMLSDAIVHRGQAIALVVAESYEIATHAASLITARYEEEAFSSTIDSEGVDIVVQAESPIGEMFGDTIAGDAASAFATATTIVDATFHTHAQHANPIELVSTVAIWEGENVTIYEGTQHSASIRFGLAAQLGIPPEQVTVISPTVGGAFGQKNSLQNQTALAARAARMLDRPVKLVMRRDQLFGTGSFRAESRHRMRLGADENGQLIAALYDVDAQTSRHDLFPADYTGPASRLHNIPNFQGHQRLVRTDTQTPGYMRAPFEHMSSFAMESAIDEMAYLLDRDPVEFRLAHDTQTDVVTGRPFSSRYLAECLQQGAERFGWSRRDPRPQSMRDAAGNQIGWGVAAGCYKAATAPAIAQLVVREDGTAEISVGVHEMGAGHPDRAGRCRCREAWYRTRSRHGGDRR
jgi:xanthine dehydrogenase YagR molybdenum-binding subunit